MLKQAVLLSFKWLSLEGQRGRYIDWLRAGRSWGQSFFSHGRGKNFVLLTSSRELLGPTQPPIQWVRGRFFPGDKAAGT
jgi:hypothetical protein